MKKYIYIAIGVIVAVLLSLYIGKSIGEKNQKNKQIKTQIKVIHKDNKEAQKKIDSLNLLVKDLSKKDVIYKNREVVIREKAKNIVIEKPANKECEDLYNKATEKIGYLEETINIKDSIETNLRTQLKLKDNIIFEKDRQLSNKDREIELLKDLGKPRDKKYSISIHVGTGGAVTKNNNSINVQFVPVYVGVGLSRNIISF